jgi:hypothetical protein
MSFCVYTTIRNAMHWITSSRQLFAVAAFVLAAAFASAASPVHSERFIAIDGACGWPLLTQLPSGDITCLIWPNPSHGFTEGQVDSWRSHDQGRTWQRTGSPVPYAPATNRMNHAGGLTTEGSFIAMVGGWDRRERAGWVPKTPQEKSSIGSHYVGAKTLDPIPAVSTDSGSTWKQFAAIGPTPSTRGGWVPYGHIAPVSASTLGVCLYQEEVAFYVSTDEGATWTRRGQLSTGRTHNETTWLRLANGDLFAASRTFADERVDAFRSTDGGTTWKSEGPLTLPRQHPADLTALPDGRVLLSYGVRNEGEWAIHVRVGDATGHTWSAPVCLVDLEGSTDEPAAPKPLRDGGYPSTVAFADGTLVTAYYCKGLPAHQRYHVGVIRWNTSDLPAKSK